MKPRKKLLILILSFCCLFFWPSWAFASTSTDGYLITEQELSSLENTLTELKQINATLQQGASESQRQLIEVRKELKKSKEDLVASRQELAAVKKELLQSKIEVEKIRYDLIEANNLLKKQKESLDKYEREVKQQLNRSRLETAVVGVLAVYLMSARK